MVFFFLCIISIVEVFSASSELTYKGGNYMGPMLKHLFILAGGAVCMILTLNTKCKYFKIVTPILLGISWILLLWVLVAGHAVNGAGRWINFFGLQFQPSELAKVLWSLPRHRFLLPWRQTTVQSAKPSNTFSSCGYSSFPHHAGEPVHSYSAQFCHLPDDDYRSGTDTSAHARSHLCGPCLRTLRRLHLCLWRRQESRLQ